jgi:CheY-like chemotaxis protein
MTSQNLESLHGLPVPISVLVIDDEIMIAMYMDDILTDLGCRVATAGRVDDALAIIRAQHLDFAFLDVSVCGEPIAPVVRELRMRSIPFAFVTGYNANLLPADYRNHPILSKPVSEADLSAVLAGIFLQPAAA